MFNRFTLAGTLVGGLADHQECVDFCAKNKIYPDCEIIEANQLDWAFKQLNAPGGNATAVRYVVDIKKSL